MVSLLEQAMIYSHRAWPGAPFSEGGWGAFSSRGFYDNEVAFWWGTASVTLDSIKPAVFRRSSLHNLGCLFSTS
jgi:hypothetical protein